MAMFKVIGKRNGAYDVSTVIDKDIFHVLRVLRRKRIKPLSVKELF